MPSNVPPALHTLDETDALGRERDISLGNGRAETREYDEAAGYLVSIATDGGVQDLEFTYDEVGNVLTRFDDLIDETETFTYDDLHRLKTSQVTGETLVTLYYSAAGRITSKSDVGSYTYGAGAAGPFAVTSANGLSYTYDANGRMITRGSNDITWYSFDQPKKIENGTKTTEFWYGPDRARYKQELRTSGGLDATIRYVSALFEFEDAATDVYRHYVHSGSRVVAMVERIGTTNTKHFLHRDNQGSVTKVTNSSGSVIQALAYDAWGLRRDATDWSALGSPFSGSHETERGYTGHEHLDTVGLIHMNGRVQDPVLGRFISADPIVQAPFNTQSHNRYSYVWNNPGSLVDPSGFQAGCLPDDPEREGQGHGYADEPCNEEDKKRIEELYALGQRQPDRGPRNSDFRVVTPMQLAIMSNNGPPSQSSSAAGSGTDSDVMEVVVATAKRRSADSGGDDRFTIPMIDGFTGGRVCPARVYPDSCSFVPFYDEMFANKTNLEVGLIEWEDKDWVRPRIRLEQSVTMSDPTDDWRTMYPPRPWPTIVVTPRYIPLRGGSVLQEYSLSQDGYCRCTDGSGGVEIFYSGPKRFPNIFVPTGGAWEQQFIR